MINLIVCITLHFSHFQMKKFVAGSEDSQFADGLISAVSYTYTTAVHLQSTTMRKDCSQLAKHELSCTYTVNFPVASSYRGLSHSFSLLAIVSQFSRNRHGQRGLKQLCMAHGLRHPTDYNYSTSACPQLCFIFWLESLPLGYTCYI